MRLQRRGIVSALVAKHAAELLQAGTALHQLVPTEMA